MGANFYWLTISHDIVTQKLHIGKSSDGWTFSLHVYPDLGIHDLLDWQDKFCQPWSIIMNEYGASLESLTMIEIIKNRKWLGVRDDEEWYKANFALPGPNGLARRQLSTFCIKHGEGTWDCCIGNFS